MPKGVYDRGKGKARVNATEVAEEAREKGVAFPPAVAITQIAPDASVRVGFGPVKRCDRCEAFEPDDERLGRGLCLLNPEPVHKYGNMWCLQWRAKG